jgi:AraC family transcriptional regulator
MVGPIYLSDGNPNVQKCSILALCILPRYPTIAPPDSTKRKHFSEGSVQHNVIFNAFSPESRCDNHVGCLSLKTVLSGEEWYGVDGRHLAIRPGQFLILNDDQDLFLRHP